VPLYGNQVAVRQHAQCFGNRSPAHAEHDGQKLVREKKLVAVDAIMRHQKPAREALLDGAAAVDEGRLRGLDVEGVAVAQE